MVIRIILRIQVYGKIIKFILIILHLTEMKNEREVGTNGLLCK